MGVEALPLMGREMEMGVLEAAAAGRSCVVGLIGEPGIWPGPGAGVDRF